MGRSYALIPTLCLILSHKAIMHLKEARSKNKLHEFIAEREKHPSGHKHRMHAVIKSMALRSSKPKPGTSGKALPDG